MDITSINDGLTKKMVKSKSNNRVKLTQKTIGFIRHGSFTFTSQERAREIMQDNFFGVEEAIKHFGVNPSKRELAALANVPFTEETLTACRYTHILIAVFPLSILDIHDKMDRKFLYWSREHAWYNEQAFAKDKGEIGWHLIRKTPVPGSTEKTWDEQQKLISKDEETLNARVLIYTMIGHFLSSSGKYRKRLFDGINREYSIYVRCSDLVSPGRGVTVGGFTANSGVSAENTPLNNRLHRLGVASARKS